MVVGMYYKIVDLSTLIGINNKNKSRTNSMLYYNYLLIYFYELICVALSPEPGECRHIVCAYRWRMYSETRVQQIN